MESLADKAMRAARFTAGALAETLWPTRCALCDKLGDVLCERCARNLPYVDWWRACRRCGAPFGYVQCCACSPVALGRLGRDAWPFKACASAVVFDDESGQLVRVYKDQGEQRLAQVMAASMARAVPPAWGFDAVTFVPATLAAYRRRGFDHAELIARAVADRLNAPCVATLARPRTRDQRALSGAQRVANLRGSFSLAPGAVPASVLLVDDVCTTGATLCEATDALLAAGCREVSCLTYARV